MKVTKKAAFNSFPYKDLLRWPTFLYSIDKKFKKPHQLTDLCEYCEYGKILKEKIITLGKTLKQELKILTGPNVLDEDGSRFFKALYTNPPRMKNNSVIEK